MHAVEDVDIYSSLIRSITTGGKHGKRQEKIATSLHMVLSGVSGQ